MDYVSRSAWGAPASSPASYIASVRGVKVHWLGTTYSSRVHGQCAAYVRQVRASHLANVKERYVDIAYNFAVCEHGSVFEGRGLHKRSGANGSASLNLLHYAVLALHGTDSGAPSDAMLGGLRDAIEHCRAKGKAGDEVLGHKDGYNTQCPGVALYDWVKQGAPRPGSGSYMVRSGDTLSSIARRYAGVTWQQIAKANGIKSPYRIMPGQKLTIPKPGTSSPAPAPAPAPAKPTVGLAKLIAAAKADPPKKGTPVSYAGTKTVEAALAKEGLLSKVYVDGHFGTQTIAAYAAWQRRLGYSGRDADGIPGRTSLTRLGKSRGFDVKD